MDKRTKERRYYSAVKIPVLRIGVNGLEFWFLVQDSLVERGQNVNEVGMAGILLNQAERNALHLRKNRPQEGVAARNYNAQPVRHISPPSTALYVYPTEAEVLRQDFNSEAEEYRHKRHTAADDLHQNWTAETAYARGRIMDQLDEAAQLHIANGGRINDIPFALFLERLRAYCMPSTEADIDRIDHLINTPYQPGENKSNFINKMEQHFQQKDNMLNTVTPDSIKVQKALNVLRSVLKEEMAYLFDSYCVRQHGEISTYTFADIKELCRQHEAIRPTQPIKPSGAKRDGRDRTRRINSVEEDDDSNSEKKGARGGKGIKTSVVRTGEETKARAAAISAFATKFDKDVAAVNAASARGGAAHTDSLAPPRKIERVYRPFAEYEPCEFCNEKFGVEKIYEHTEKNCSNNPRNMAKAQSSVAAGGGGGSRTSSTRARGGGAAATRNYATDHADDDDEDDF